MAAMGGLQTSLRVATPAITIGWFASDRRAESIA
jgi:hypothetical protein